MAGNAPSPPAAESPSSPSQQSTDSGTSTQPNTEREVDYERLRKEQGTANNIDDVESNNDPDSSGSSSLSRSHTRTDFRAHGLLHTAKFDLNKARALAEWGDGQGGTEICSLSDIHADIYWTPNAGKAFFRVRAQVPMKARARVPEPIFLFIYPERIRQLSVDLESSDQKVGGDTVVLRFGLSRQGALVLPKESHRIKNQKGRNTLATLRRLAAQLDFTLHVSISRIHIGGNSLQELCAAISRGETSTIHVHADTKSLYRGHGAQVIEGASLEEAAAVASAAVASAAATVAAGPGHGGGTSTVDVGNNICEDAFEGPPAYNEVGPGPPMDTVTKGIKRRRVSTSSASAQDEDPVEGSSVEKKFFDALPHSARQPLMKLFADQEKLFARHLTAQAQQTQQMLAEQERQFEQKLAAQGEQFKALAARVQQFEVLLTAKVNDVRSEVDEQYDYISETVDRKVEEEMQDTQERVLRYITRGHMRATILLDSPDRDLG